MPRCYSRGVHRVVRAVGIWLALGTLGCASPNGATEVIVVFDASDDDYASRIATIEYEIYTRAGRRVTTDDDPPFEVDALPLFGLRLSPDDGELGRGFQVVAEAFDGMGNSLGRQHVEGPFEYGELRHVWMMFDPDCADVECPDGYRCRSPLDGPGHECVERCVEPTSTDRDRVTVAATCTDRCLDRVCASEQHIASCEDGVRVIDRTCELGCAGLACNDVVASNTGDVIGPRAGELRDLIVPPGGTIAFRGDGDIRQLDPPSMDSLREPGTDAQRMPWTLDDENDLVILEVNDLIVGERGSLLLGNDGSYVFLVHGEARIDGRIIALRTNESSGFFDGLTEDDATPLDGSGGSGGGPGIGGGAGGSYGTRGGRGGDGNGGGSGGAPADTLATPELVPLLRGSFGGAAGDGTLAGFAGGSVQITARQRITIGPWGSILANAMEAVLSRRGCGGSTGGGVLLEAPEVTLEPLTSEELMSLDARISAQGADGCRSSDGDEAQRSDTERPAEDGVAANVGGGGAGGPGRVRINTFAGENISDYAGRVIPSSLGLFTVGRVQLGTPP